MDEGDRVQFEVEHDPKGSQAKNVSKISSAISEEEIRRQKLASLVDRINAFADSVAAGPKLSGWARVYRDSFNGIRYGALFLPLLLFTVWWAWQIHRRRLLLEKRSTAGTPELQRLVVKGASSQLFHSPRFRRAAQQLRRHREVGSSELDAHSTVAMTIEKGGWFTPVYRTRQVLPEYLVLIDRASFHDQQARFVDEADAAVAHAEVRASGVEAEDLVAVVAVDDAGAAADGLDRDAVLRVGPFAVVGELAADVAAG